MNALSISGRPASITPGISSQGVGLVRRDHSNTSSFAANWYKYVLLWVTADQPDALAEMPGVIEAGVPTLKAFLVYDFGVDEATAPGAGDGVSTAGCSRSTARTGRCSRRYGAAPAAGRSGRGSRDRSRPPDVEAAATARAIGLARAAGAPVYLVHVSSAMPSRRSPGRRRARRCSPRRARTTCR